MLTDGLFVLGERSRNSEIASASATSYPPDCSSLVWYVRVRTCCSTPLRGGSANNAVLKGAGHVA
jgi:hypothetical protein